MASFVIVDLFTNPGSKLETENSLWLSVSPGIYYYLYYTTILMRLKLAWNSTAVVKGRVDWRQQHHHQQSGKKTHHVVQGRNWDGGRADCRPFSLKDWPWKDFQEKSHFYGYKKCRVTLQISFFSTFKKIPCIDFDELMLLFSPKKCLAPRNSIFYTFSG